MHNNHANGKSIKMIKEINILTDPEFGMKPMKKLLINYYDLLYSQVQFCLILFNTQRSWQTNCGIENKFYYIFVLNVTIIFYQFYRFYKIAYSAKKLKTQKKRKSFKT